MNLAAHPSAFTSRSRPGTSAPFSLLLGFGSRTVSRAVHQHNTTSPLPVNSPPRNRNRNANPRQSQNIGQGSGRHDLATSSHLNLDLSRRVLPCARISRPDQVAWRSPTISSPVHGRSQLGTDRDPPRSTPSSPPRTAKPRLRLQAASTCSSRLSDSRDGLGYRGGPGAVTLLTSRSVVCVAAALQD